MPNVSARTLRIATDHDSHFLRAVREMVHRRPHLNPCFGSTSYRNKKRDGERAIRYEEVVSFLQVARREGAKRGVGAEMVAVLLNEIVKDSLPDGAQLDVVAKPAEGDPAPLSSRRDEELYFSVSAAELVVTIEQITADGRVDVHEATRLESTAQKVARQTRRLVTAARSGDRS